MSRLHSAQCRHCAGWYLPDVIRGHEANCRFAPPPPKPTAAGDVEKSGAGLLFGLFAVLHGTIYEGCAFMARAELNRLVARLEDAEHRLARIEGKLRDLTRVDWYHAADAKACTFGTVKDQAEGPWVKYEDIESILAEVNEDDA
jgi:hypothetical protein